MKEECAKNRLFGQNIMITRMDGSQFEKAEN